MSIFIKSVWLLALILPSCLAAAGLDVAQLEARVAAEMDQIIDQTGEIPEKDKAEAKRLAEEGIKAHDQGNFSKAVELYTKALKKHPTWSLLYYEMGYSHSAAGEQEKALEAVLRALYLDPKSEQYHTMKASILDDLGMSDDAVRSYLRLLELQPNSFLANLNLGITYTRIREFDKAETVLLKARQISPAHPSPLVHLANLARARGETYVEERYLDEFQKIGEKDPRLPAVKQRLDELRRVEIGLSFPESGKAQDASFSVATAEALQRALWRTQRHRATYPEAKSYSPSFEEEMDVLKIVIQIWAEAKKKDASLVHPRYDTALAACDAGFMTEYVWYVNQDKLGATAKAWTAENATRLEAFQAWASSSNRLEALKRDTPTPSQTTEQKPDFRDLFATVMASADKSKLTYQLGDVQQSDAATFFKNESARFRSGFKKSGTNCVKKADARKSLASMVAAFDAAPLVHVFRTFSPADAEWDTAAQMLSRSARRYRDLTPPTSQIGSISKKGKTIQVKATDPAWLPYLLAKAVWRYEPGFRQQFGGSEEEEVSALEEVFAWAVIVGGNMNIRANKKEKPAEDGPDPIPYVEQVERIVQAEALHGFVLFEVLHKGYGVPLECINEKQARDLGTYLSAFVFEPLSKGQ